MEKICHGESVSGSGSIVLSSSQIGLTGLSGENWEYGKREIKPLRAK